MGHSAARLSKSLTRPGLTSEAVCGHSVCICVCVPCRSFVCVSVCFIGPCYVRTCVCVYVGPTRPMGVNVCVCVRVSVQSERTDRVAKTDKNKKNRVDLNTLPTLYIYNEMSE